MFIVEVPNSNAKLFSSNGYNQRRLGMTSPIHVHGCIEAIHFPISGSMGYMRGMCDV